MLVKLVADKLPSNASINTDHDVSGAGSDVAIVKFASPDSVALYAIDGIQFSYSAVPTTGRLIVTKAGAICFDVDLRQAIGYIPLYITCPNNKDLEVRLKSGGPGVIGKLNVQSHLEPA